MPNSSQDETRPIQTSHAQVVKTTDATFRQDVLDAPGLVLVDFWAEWCGPCKFLAPLLDKVATEYEDRLTIAKIDVDKNPVTPQRMGIRSLPTLLIMRNGEVEHVKVGMFTMSELYVLIESRTGLERR